MTNITNITNLEAQILNKNRNLIHKYVDDIFLPMEFYPEDIESAIMNVDKAIRKLKKHKRMLNSIANEETGDKMEEGAIESEEPEEPIKVKRIRKQREDFRVVDPKNPPRAAKNILHHVDTPDALIKYCQQNGLDDSLFEEIHTHLMQELEGNIKFVSANADLSKELSHEDDFNVIFMVYKIIKYDALQDIGIKTIMDTLHDNSILIPNTSKICIDQLNGYITIVIKYL